VTRPPEEASGAGGDLPDADPGIPPRPSRSFLVSLAAAAARGAGLIAVAVAIGVVLLQFSDHSRDQLSAVHRPISGAPAPPEPATTTTTTTATARTADQVTVLVLNASGRTNQARPMSDRLRVVGYRTLEPGNAAVRPASTVSCKAGFEREAPALVAATGLPATVAALAAADAALTHVSDADCVVIIGSR
jgi:LytR cell envelope-related transcriptional attenuator